MNLVGIFGQIRDDFMNIYSTEVSTWTNCNRRGYQHSGADPPSQYTNTKGFADDISEGKYSFPMIHGIQASAGDRTLEG